MIVWITIIGMGLITFAIRLSPILLLERFELSPPIRRALKFVPAAVLSAIILPELMIAGETLALTFTNERLLAGLAAGIVAWRTKNVLWTIAAGMGMLWLLSWAGL